MASGLFSQGGSVYPPPVRCRVLVHNHVWACPQFPDQYRIAILCTFTPSSLHSGQVWGFQPAAAGQTPKPGKNKARGKKKQKSDACRRIKMRSRTSLSSIGGVEVQLSFDPRSHVRDHHPVPEQFRPPCNEKQRKLSRVEEQANVRACPRGKGTATSTSILGSRNGHAPF